MASIDNDMRGEAVYREAMDREPAYVKPSREWGELEPVTVERWKRMKPLERKLELWRKATGQSNRVPEGI